MAQGARPKDLLPCHFLEDGTSNFLPFLQLALNSRIIWTKWNLLLFFGARHITTETSDNEHSIDLELHYVIYVLSRFKIHLILTRKRGFPISTPHNFFDEATSIQVHRYLQQRVKKHKIIYRVLMVSYPSRKSLSFARLFQGVAATVECLFVLDQ